LRKALFAILLIGASFAGGAVVNGPGLKWAQEAILSHLNSEGDGDEDESALNGEKTSNEENAEPPPQPLLAPAFSSSESLASSEPFPASEETETPERAKTESNLSRTSAETSQSGSNSSGEEASGKESSDDPPIALVQAPAPYPENAPAPLDPLPPASEPIQSESLNRGGGDQGGSKRKSDSATAASQAPASPGRESAVQSAGIASPEGGDPSDWTELRRRMASLGVVRYEFEGEPNGRVRFRCVIPLAGRRAVAQQFEAEGNNEMEAAGAALQRVALWKATEQESPAP